MSEPTSWNTPLTPDGPAPSAAPAAAPPAGRLSRQKLILVGGGVAGALALGAFGFVLLSGGDGELPPLAQAGKPPAKSPSPSASPVPTGLPTVSTVNGRNPFASRETGESTSSGATSSASTTSTSTPSATTTTPAPTVTTTVSVPVSVPGPTTTVAGPTATVTATSPTDVFLTLSSLAIDETAVFWVNGASYEDVAPGDTFGPSDRFSYDATTVPVSETCARVTYVEEQFTVCPGQQLNVS